MKVAAAAALCVQQGLLPQGWRKGRPFVGTRSTGTPDGQVERRPLPAVPLSGFSTRIRSPEVRALGWRVGKVRAVCLSPDGLRAAVSPEGGKGWVTVFDLE